MVSEYEAAAIEAKDVTPKAMAAFEAYKTATRRSKAAWVAARAALQLAGEWHSRAGMLAALHGAGDDAVAHHQSELRRVQNAGREVTRLLPQVP